MTVHFDLACDALEFADWLMEVGGALSASVSDGAVGTAEATPVYREPTRGAEGQVELDSETWLRGAVTAIYPVTASIDALLEAARLAFGPEAAVGFRAEPIADGLDWNLEVRECVRVSFVCFARVNDRSLISVAVRPLIRTRAMTLEILQ